MDCMHRGCDWQLTTGVGCWGDKDAGGRLDIVVSGNFAVLAVLRGQGDGSFRPAVEFSTGGSVFPFVLRDLNHDKLPEAILGDGNTLTVLFNTSFKE